MKKQIGPMTLDVWRREFVPLLPAAGRDVIRVLALVAWLLLACWRAPSIPASGSRIRPNRRATSA